MTSHDKRELKKDIDNLLDLIQDTEKIIKQLLLKIENRIREAG